MYDGKRLESFSETKKTAIFGDVELHVAFIRWLITKITSSKYVVYTSDQISRTTVDQIQLRQYLKRYSAL